MPLPRRYLVALVALFPFSLVSAGALPAVAAPTSTSSPSIIVEPGAGPSPIISLIRSARHSIKLEIYILSNKTIIQELGRAKQRGVDVRVLLEERPYGASRYASSAYTFLRQSHVSVRWANESAFTYTHEKALVIDSRVAGIFSFNLSSSAFYSNREFGVIDQSASDVLTLTTVFNADWNRRGMHLPSTRLVVSPYNSRTDLDRLIDNSRRTLDLYAEEVADSGIENRLARARARGVRVRLITSSDSAGVTALRHSGVAVTLMANPYVHAKAIVADDRKVFIGSENLSSTSLNDNREVGILLNNASLASVVERTFANDWRNNSSPSTIPATPRPGTHGLSVGVSTSPSTVRRGQELLVKASTSPGASCTIRVTYPDGYVSRAKSLSGSKIAGSNGVVSWSWRVGSTVTGTSQASVTCRLNGSTATGSANFQVI